MKLILGHKYIIVTCYLLAGSWLGLDSNRAHSSLNKPETSQP